MKLKKWLVGLVVGLALMVGTTVAANDPGPVFNEIKALVAQEGLPEPGGVCAYRQGNDGTVYAIIRMDAGGVCIGANDLNGSIYLVGYFPEAKGSDDPSKGEFMKGLMYFGGLVGRESISKEEANEKAKELLTEYKKGRKVTINTWMGQPEGQEV